MGFLALADLHRTLAINARILARATLSTFLRRATSSIRTSRKVLCNHFDFLKLFHFVKILKLAYSLKDFRHSPFSFYFCLL